MHGQGLQQSGRGELEGGTEDEPMELEEPAPVVTKPIAPTKSNANKGGATAAPAPTKVATKKIVPKQPAGPDFVSLYNLMVEKVNVVETCTRADLIDAIDIMFEEHTEAQKCIELKGAAANACYEQIAIRIEECFAEVDKSREGSRCSRNFLLCRRNIKRSWKPMRRPFSLVCRPFHVPKSKKEQYNFIKKIEMQTNLNSVIVHLIEYPG